MAKARGRRRSWSSMIVGVFVVVVILIVVLVATHVIGC